MYAAVVEFDTLADTVRTRAENDDLFLIRSLAFVVVTAFESGVEIRGFCFELRRAGIYHFINTGDTSFFPFIIYIFFITMLQDTADLFIAESVHFGFLQ